jgi:hypothetical protein
MLPSTKVGLGLDELDMKGLRSMSLDDVAMVIESTAASCSAAWVKALAWAGVT